MSGFIEYTAQYWRGLDLRKLGVDQAYLVPVSNLAQKAYLYLLSEECYTCPYTKLETIHPAPSAHVIPINVERRLKFRLIEQDVGPYAFDNDTSMCEIAANSLREFGVYNFTIDFNGTCSIVTDKDGVNVNLSFLSVFVLMALFLSIVRMAWCSWKSYWYNSELVSNNVNTDQNVNVPPVQKRRMRSLDAFRGLAIILMIFVNSGGGGYWWVEHAIWNGLHVADIVFPFFMWIMGVCIPISTRSQLSRGTGKWRICCRIAWRSLKLFLIGLCLNSINGPQMENLRIMGVLQRFGIAYFVCGSVHTIFSKREYVEPQSGWKRFLRDLIIFRGEVMVTIVLIVINLSVLFGAKAADCPRAYLGPGGKDSYLKYQNCTGGIAGYIDLQVLGNNHIYQHATAKHVYKGSNFDPEGIFGSLLSIVQVFLGLLCGVQILTFADWKARIKRWLAWSVLFGLLGGILSGFSEEGGIIPINKNMWSLSFVLVTTSLAYFLLSGMYWAVDVKHWHSGFPFVECGMNAIIMYVGHTVMHKMLPWHWRIGAMNTHFVLLLESTWNTLLWIAIALYLDSKEFYYSL